MLEITDFDICVEENPITQLENTLLQAPTEGAIMEFGVCKGHSIGAIASVYPDRIVYGFDSFVGLPENWKRSETSTYFKGHFGRERPPKVSENVELVVGFFDTSLPKWLKENNPASIAFLHIDSDLYSSAKTVLYLLNHLIHPGTIIVFDELCDWTGKNIYTLWREGEWKALLEWIEEFNREVTPISRTNLYAAALKVER